MDTDDARRELEQVEASHERTVSEILAVLSVDVPAFVQRTVRRVFTASERADQIQDAALTELKAGTLEASISLRDHLQTELGDPKAWAWDGPEPPPVGASDLSAHPRVAAALEGASGPAVMLWEAAPLPVSAKKLQERLGVRSVLFSPCEGPPASGDYITEMNAGLDRLEAALSGG